MLCSKTCDARDLRPNCALREVLANYLAVRPVLLASFKEQQQAQGVAEIPLSVPQHRQLQGKRLHPQQQGTGAKSAAGGWQWQTQSASMAATAAGSAACNSEVDLAGDSSSEPVASSTSEASRSWDSDGSSSSDAAMLVKRQRKSMPCGHTAGKLHSGSATHHSMEDSGLQLKQAAATAGCTTGFVQCPICSKAVPSFYINSHVDLCLLGGGGGDGSSQPGKAVMGDAEAGVGNRQLLSVSVAHQNEEALVPGEPFRPLMVPPKVVPGLASEKSLRALLKKYSLPTEGKKKVCNDAPTTSRFCCACFCAVAARNC